MNEQLSELYQELILEHNRSPRNFKKIEHPTHYADGFNPLCGDHYTVFLTVTDDIIVDVGFQGSGCAISKSSASMMSAAVKGHSIKEAQTLFSKFHHVITKNIEEEFTEEEIDELGSLGALAGVREFPARIKCASLPWHALQAALTANEPKVSTE